MNAEAASDPSRKRRSSSDGPFPVRLRLLGGFGVWVGSCAVSEGAWHLRKAKSLVKLLALAPGHALHREQIMDLLWPELSKRAASNNLRGSLHGARRALSADSIMASHYLSSKEERVALCPEVELWVDVEAFEEAANAARRSREPDAYRAALELYGGELLPEDRYEEWAEGRRGELLGLYLALLVELAGLYQEHGDHHSAVARLREVLAKEPTNEEAHVGLMRLYALSGQSGEALRQYERLREVLSAELGAEPSAPTCALKEEIATGSFPPPRSSPTAPVVEEHADVGTHNLPAPRSRFVGRERELIEVKRALAMTRVLTLTGAGGSGKTRLALEVARDLVGAYPDGVWLVELAPLSEGKLIAHAVAEALGVPEQPGRSLNDALVDALREKRVLVVLDNCEHLIEEAARLVDVLLGLCPRLRILATSREALNVEGEVVWRVPTLAVPDPGRPPAPTELRRYDAVRLFVERARLRLPDFEPTPQNAGAVVQICRRLEGMPLAMELAAARVGALSLEQISGRLEDSLKLLTGGSRTATRRQRTLRGALDWSYELLLEEERTLFRRLSAFAGWWTLEAAEAVGAAGGIEEDIMDVLSNLVDKSLVVTEPEAPEVVRYRMLESVRQYAREQLEESGEAEAIRRRHASFYLALAKEAESGLTGAQQQAWADQLEAEHDNLRAALSWSLENEPQTALQLAETLARFWEIRSHFLEGSRWLEAVLQETRHTDTATRAEALTEAGTFAFHRGDYRQATVLHGEALTLYKELGDERGVAFALMCLGVQALEQGDYERAKPLFEEALASSQQLGDERTSAYTLHNLGEVARFRGEYGQAKTRGMEALAMFREMDDKWCVARTLSWLGMVTVYKSDDREAAAGFLREGLALNREIGGWEWVAYSLEGFASLVGAKAEGERAAMLWGAAEALREEIGSPIQPTDRADYDRSVAAARTHLEGAAWEAAWKQGKEMSLEEAIEYALLGEEPTPPEPSAPEEEAIGTQPAGLTRREQEVANLIGRRLTTRQIASQLHISEHTIDKHVANILSKLNLHSREQVGAKMAKQRSHPF
jgi:predicted ATPase/DNA-binding SARP family transcriptional activator/DNA-binding CsgD family transcriptional regulator